MLGIHNMYLYILIFNIHTYCYYTPNTLIDELQLQTHRDYILLSIAAGGTAIVQLISKPT